MVKYPKKLCFLQSTTSSDIRLFLVHLHFALPIVPVDPVLFGQTLTKCTGCCRKSTLKKSRLDKKKCIFLLFLINKN